MAQEVAKIDVHEKSRFGQKNIVVVPVCDPENVCGDAIACERHFYSGSSLWDNYANCIPAQERRNFSLALSQAGSVGLCDCSHSLKILLFQTPEAPARSFVMFESVFVRVTISMIPTS